MTLLDAQKDLRSEYLFPVKTLADIPLAFVDLETTGLSPRFGHRVIEVGVLRVENGVVTREFQRLINPCRGVGDSITRLTGICEEMLADSPRFPAIIDELYDVLRGAVIVGHNTSFDASFLRHELMLCGRVLCDDLCHPPVLDTLRLARRLSRGQRNGLGALCARLGVSCDRAAHRAIGDCYRTLGVFHAMLSSHGGFTLGWREFLRLHGRVGTLRDRTMAARHFEPLFPVIEVRNEPPAKLMIAAQTIDSMLSI